MAELTSLPEYLEARKDIIRSREAFFGALKMYLGAEHRSDAGDLEEPYWNDPARQIKGLDWVLNPTRGYLVLKEDRRSRPFRLTIDQPGNLLVLTLTVPAETTQGSTEDPFDQVNQSLADLEIGAGAKFGHPESERLNCRWQINMPNLYTDARAFEQGLHYGWRVFDAAVCHLIRR